MQPLEFIGGKYRNAEQILPGVIETFRAERASTGEPVFVHRVSRDEPVQEAALLRLLAAALLRSANARKLVLDVKEEDGFSYVVTATASRCLLLREWLQCEVDEALREGAEKNTIAQPDSAPATAGSAARKPSSASEASTVISGPAEPGEFTRLFRPGDIPPQAPEPAKPPTAVPPPVTAPVENPSTSAAPGEFTRFFRGDMPAAAPKTPSAPQPETAAPSAATPPAPDSAPEKPFKTRFVQRPNTPLPGEFTRLFSSKASTESGPAHPIETSAPRPDRSSSPAPGDPTQVFPAFDTFPQQRNAVPADVTQPPARPDFLRDTGPAAQPPPERSQPPGEFTRIFSNGSSLPAFSQQSAAPEAPRPILDDVLFHAPGQQRVPQPSSGPSEFTMVVQGRPPDLAATSAPPASTSSATPAPSGAAPNLTPPVGAMKLASPPLPVTPPQVKPPSPPAVPVKVPQPAVDSNKKLVLFFIALGVLAVILIIFIVLLAVRK